jgi:proprotein convertase subtilisin/kexin type 5
MIIWRQSVQINLCLFLCVFCLCFIGTEGAGKNIKCPSGTYSNSTTKSCQPCPVGCTTCSVASSFLTCSGCDTSSGFSIIKVVTNTNTIIYRCKCPSGLFANSVTRKCAACSSVIPNCQQCTANLIAGTTFCSTCTLGHYADTPRTACLACPANCITCSSPTTCLTCKNSYFMVNSLCVLICSKFKSQCQTCTDTGASIVCDSCATGYYLQTVAPSNQCNACHTACTNCGPSGCLACSNGFLLLSPTCVSC